MIKCKVLCIQLFSLLAIAEITYGQIQRQVRTPVAPLPVSDSQLAGTDSALAETGFAGAVQAGSKYFQYAHNPVKDHYEVGHKRGNDHHFIERHEKAHPHEGEFKTKVRWGDKHGGYGEHYWDYNHAGHGGHDGEESQLQEQYVAYEEPQNKQTQRQKRGNQDDVEFVDEEAKYKILNGVASKHGGNYRRLPELDRNRRHFY